MDTQFYRAFEDRFRGSCELITERLRVYLPFIAALLEIYPQAQAIDLGSGRGEWLSLLVESGMQAIGIDNNDAMLDEARTRGLNVICQDAMTYLQTLPDASQALISAFHFVEHIPFEKLMLLVKEALRVLKPGGLLILETPNSENLMVGSSQFYLDPTHQRPIPAPLLAFLTEYCGFNKIKILRLQETIQAHQPSITLADVLLGVSSDYAIVAQKATDTLNTSKIDALFSQTYGVSLDELAHAYHVSNHLAMRDLIHHEIRLSSRIKQWCRKRSWCRRLLKQIRGGA